MSSRRHIFIAGNGPSLRELDFSLLQGRDWLGMNAAYRHWDRLCIYPRLYCCLDPVVVKSHAEQIRRLHAEGRVERFFLVRAILDALPDFPQDDRVFFLEDMVRSEQPGAEVFRTAFPDKKTTGSWAVRFAIFLGYRDIALGGIDCNYVEVIREAEHTGVGLELKIGQDVARNPNYFFDDYQQQGDIYQVPNPEQHFGNLHLQSFEALNLDIARLGLEVRVVNTAKTSRLHRFGVYAFQPLQEALGRPALQAVAVPLTARELPQLLANLALWEEPSFRPLRPDSPIIGQVDLSLFFDGPHDQAILEAVEAAWARLPAVRSCFRRIDVEFLAIPQDLNHYIRDASRRDVPRKMGPNLHFLATMRACRAHRFVQLMETDCVPAKADWLTDLDAICRGADPFWIAGATVPELGPLSPSLAHHLNGNALYATGDEGFQRFLDETFQPALRHLLLVRDDHHLAYDCLLARLADLARTGDDATRAYAAEVQRHAGRFRAITAIGNLSLAESRMDDAALLAMLEEDHVLLHSRRLAELLAEAAATSRRSPAADLGSDILARRFTDTFLKIPQGAIHASRAYSNLEGCEVRRLDRARGDFVLAIEEGVAGQGTDHGAFVLFDVPHAVGERKLACRLSLESKADRQVHVRFSCHGDGPFVEDAADVDVAGGVVREIDLSFDCLGDCRQVRLLFVPGAGAPGVIHAVAVVTASGDGAASNSRGAALDLPGNELFDGFRKQAAPTQPAQATLVPLSASREAGLPRLLMVDSTPLGHASATGQLKKTYLEGWPDGSFLQVWSEGPSLRLLRKHKGEPRTSGSVNSVDEIVRQCSAFRPDVVYFRPVDSEVLFDVVTRLADQHDAPLVLHMMDDWPSRLRTRDPELHAALDARLRQLVGRAQGLLAISESMAAAYGDRYGGIWEALANGADPSLYPPLPKPPRSAGEAFTLRYMGALAEDMTFASVCDVARAVARLSTRLPVRFEIHTMDWCRDRAREALAGLPGVEVSPLVPGDEYESTLGGSDALLIAYNFDPDSIAYIGYSLANKMPECLASGAPLIAYGPPGVATIDYLAGAGIAEVVQAREEALLVAAIERLVTDPAHGAQLAARARGHVEEHLTTSGVQARFRDAIRDAWVLGPFPREAGAHFDETDCVAALYEEMLEGAVMVDVGAHHGHALFPFAKMGWRVFAFEPDNDNRALLERRLADANLGPEKVLLDDRAVSDNARVGVEFFRSDQSTGISGLSAFHATHESRQTVDITTLRDVLANHDVPGIDFLKIDTEGHDLFVLKGFPWERFSPAVIECEFEDAKTLPLGYTFHDMASYLVERGFQVFVSEWHPIVRYGIRHDWRRLVPYPCELSDPSAWGNLLAFRDPLPGRAMPRALGKLLRVATDAREVGLPVEFGAPSARSRYRPLVDPAFRHVSRSIWRYRHRPGAQQKLWMVVDDNPGETAGNTYAGTIRMRSDVPMRVNVSLGRVGFARYEGTTRIVDLQPGQFHEVRVSATFQANHPGLKLQLYVQYAPPGQEASLLVDSVAIAAIPSRLEAAHLGGKLDFRAANDMLRAGDVEGASVAYRLLYARHALRIYHDNLDMAKSGIRTEAPA